MRVLHVAESIGINSGGVGVVVEHLHKGLDEKGIESCIVTQSSIDDIDALYGCDNQKHSKFYQIKNNLEFLLSEIKPEIIHIHGLWNIHSHACINFSKRNKTRVILSPHGMTHPWALNVSKLKKKIYKLLVLDNLIDKIDAFLALTDEESQSINNFVNNTSKIYVVPNPIKIHKEVINVKDRKDIIFIGRITEQKGVNKMLSPWKDIFEKNKCLENRLNIYGDGEGSYFREFEKQLKVTPHAAYHGPIYGKNKTNVLNKSKALLMMSEFEGLPMMALESMSFGVPIICNQNCGLNLEIQNGLVFSLLKKEDHLDRLGNILQNLESYSLSDAKKLIAHTEKYYSYDKVIDDMINVYTRVCSEDNQ